MPSTVSIRHIKKMFSLLLAVPLIFAAGCDKNTTAKTADGSAVAPQKVYNLKMNVSQPPSKPGWEWEPKYKVTEEFAKLLKERSNGRLNVEIFYSNQLAGPGESLDALARGTIDIQNGGFTEWAGKVPEANIAVLPYLKMGEDHVAYLMRKTEVGKLFQQALEAYGVKPLIYWPVSISGYMSTSPIAAPSDFKGLVFNNLSNLTGDFYKSVGAGTAAVPYAEQYEALLRKTIDVVQFSFYTLETYKLHEVVKSITVPPTLDPGLALVSIGKPSWDKLPADLQDILEKTALEIEAQSIEASKKMTARALDFAAKNNVNIVRMTPKNYDAFVELSKAKVWTKFASYNDRTNKMLEAAIESTKTWPKENPEAAKNFQDYFAK